MSNQFKTSKIERPILRRPLSISMTSGSSDLMLIAGLGNTGSYIAREATLRGFKVIGTARNVSRYTPPEKVDLISFDDVSPKIGDLTHLVLTAPPDPTVGDPFLAAYKNELASAKSLQWIGYVSSTGVYGDRGGAVVDEDTEPAPTNERSRRRIVAEAAWRSTAAELGVPIDIFRCGGIYGDAKYNTTFDSLEMGIARRIIKPGHSFPRIHIDDVAAAIAIAAQQGPAARGSAATRVLHLVDDSLNTPASEVVGYAATLLGVPPPPEEPFDTAWEGMTPLARSFWSEDVKVRNERTKERLGLTLRYPTYREGYAALLADRRRSGKHLPRVQGA